MSGDGSFPENLNNGFGQRLLRAHWRPRSRRTELPAVPKNVLYQSQWQGTKNKIVLQICRSHDGGCVYVSLPFVFFCVLSSLYLQARVPPPWITLPPGPRPFGSSHCCDEWQDTVLDALCVPSNGNEAALREVAPAVLKIACESYDVKESNLYFGPCCLLYYFNVN